MHLDAVPLIDRIASFAYLSSIASSIADFFFENNLRIAWRFGFLCVSLHPCIVMHALFYLLNSPIESRPRKAKRAKVGQWCKLLAYV